MKAIVYTHYGSPDVLQLTEVEKPTPRDDEVLVRVQARCLHIGDCYAVRGVPFAMRLATGLRKPKHGIPGFDVARQVEAVGAKVQRFHPGDEVFGTCHGACAEYVRVSIDRLALKPTNLTLEEAAAVPTSALTALHALRKVGKVQPGQKVLITGASVGVGTFAVQLAKAFGAEVTGVCSTPHVDLVRSIGSDQAIDYTHQDFTQGTKRYDLILDNVENHSWSACRRALTPSGTLILNSGTGRFITPLVASLFVRQKLRRYVSIPNQQNLAFLKELVKSGKLTPIIDRTCPLRETPAALSYIEGRHARGKVVITVN